ncbi:hypothetical protein GCK32_018173, partial [Trichostrongylus colubriformis]
MNTEPIASTIAQRQIAQVFFFTTIHVYRLTLLMFTVSLMRGVASGSVVEVYREKFLDSTSEKLLDAADEYHCLSLCYNEKTMTCESIIFFADSGDCLLNTDTTSNAAILKNEDEFRVVYMERKHLK